MSILSKLLKIFKSLLRAIGRILKAIWPLLLIVLVVIAIFFPPVLAAMGAWLMSAASAIWTAITGVWGWYLSLFSGLTFAEGVALALGTAFLVAPKETAEVVGDFGAAIGDGVGNAVGGATDSFLSSSGVGGWILLGLGAWVLVTMLSNDDENEKKTKVEVAPALPPPQAPRKSAYDGLTPIAKRW